MPVPSLASKLDRLFAAAPVLPFDDNSRIVIMSDCHRGQGSVADNFLPNSTLFQGALEYYDRNSFTYIELGDGDELWENRCMHTIVQTHERIFRLLDRLYRQGRLYMLCGNHDIVKMRPGFPGRDCPSASASPDGSPAMGCPPVSAVPDDASAFLRSLPVTQGLILEHTRSGIRLYLTHGHQASLINDELWRLGRFLVRHVWRPLEIIGLKAPAAPARPVRLAEQTEKALCAYAGSRNRLLVAGHTHRPAFPAPGSCPYFNDGCCIQPQTITALEIRGNAISLIRWYTAVSPSGALHLAREALGAGKTIGSCRVFQTPSRAGSACSQPHKAIREAAPLSAYSPFRRIYCKNNHTGCQV